MTRGFRPRRASARRFARRSRRSPRSTATRRRGRDVTLATPLPVARRHRRADTAPMFADRVVETIERHLEAGVVGVSLAIVVGDEVRAAGGFGCLDIDG